ncbi:MAG TPA: hypothetical protein VEB40_13245 [Flavipsychrobacter sp.]|nr:hypothetical protein [Flavipsychrobacter sp.]
MKKLMIAFLLCAAIGANAQDNKKQLSAQRTAPARQPALQVATPDNVQRTIELAQPAPSQASQQRGIEIPVVNAAQPTVPATQLSVAPSTVGEKAPHSKPRSPQGK